MELKRFSTVNDQNCFVTNMGLQFQTLTRPKNIKLQLTTNNNNNYYYYHNNNNYCYYFCCYYKHATVQ